MGKKTIHGRVEQCSQCDGDGTIYVFLDSATSESGVEIQCSKCKGKGWVCVMVQKWQGACGHLISDRRVEKETGTAFCPKCNKLVHVNQLDTKKKDIK